MRLSLLATIVAGATLAQVGASPLRVVVITNNPQELPAVQNLRFGHTLADSHVAKISTHDQPSPFINLQQPGRRPCGKRIKDKVIQISNAFRHALGLPLIETTQARPGDNVHGGVVRILPFVGTPPTFMEAGQNTSPPYFVKSFRHKTMDDQPVVRPHRHHHHHFHHGEGKSFTMRIHNALMSLGPWEGRAVAFVLGCGIGVLLRMFWVMTVVIFRAIRGEREAEYIQVAVIEEYPNAEDIVVPPPTYTLSDEKEGIKVKDAAEN